jgi:hypothetical protein
VFEHLHAGDHVELRRAFLRQRFDCDFAVFDGWRRRFHRMQLRDFQGLGRQVDAQHVGTAASHRVRQDAAATTDIQHALARHAPMRFDPVEPQRVDLVERAELAFGIPPTVGQVAELGDFLRICVHRVNGSDNMKKPRLGGALRTDARRDQFLVRVPTTSISTRRFFDLPSFVLLSATGCFLPLPSV